MQLPTRRTHPRALKLNRRNGLQRSCAAALFVAAFVLLAYEPTRWLIQTWYAPGYDSPGVLVFGLVCGIFLWSATSQVRTDGGRATQSVSSWPLALLVLSFVVRLLSQLLAINILGALMLALDVYAVGLLLRLNERARPASALWLAGLFCFALPLEPLLQRSVGFFLQQVSALGACSLLSVLHERAGCEGVRLFIDSVDVLVDLPCSGARLLILVLLGFFLLATLRRFSVRDAVVGLLLCLAIAWLGNTLRIVLLAWGIRYADSINVNVMLEPWHSIIGLGVGGVALLVLLGWGCNRAPHDSLARSNSRPPLGSSAPASAFSSAFTVPLWGAAAALVGALAIVSLRAQPVDVSRDVPAINLPLTLAGLRRTPLPLNPAEARYFAAYGGQAARAGYGEHSLLLVRTASPLRHLHAPDVCYSGAGYEVDYLGVDFRGTPSALYRVRSRSGEEFRVQARFVSSAGTTAHSISEVVWRWFSQPSLSWTMVQTVSPWPDSMALPSIQPWQTKHSGHAAAFARAVEQALNFANTSKPVSPDPMEAI